MWYVRGVYITVINVLRMPSQISTKRPYLLPILLIGAVIMVLAMMRLGVWQLDRAAQKQAMLDQVVAQAAQNEVPIASLMDAVPSQNWQSTLRFRQVSVVGYFNPEKSILIDNQVFNKQGGYRLITPFSIEGRGETIMVSRGWLPAGTTRQDLPSFTTPTERVRLRGRLNLPPAQPPLWKEGFPVNEGQVWQYLPIDQYAAQSQATVLPLMLELAPENAGSEGLQISWQKIDDHWVAKHKGYAFQWFSMAAAFFVACCVLMTKRRRKMRESSETIQK